MSHPLTRRGFIARTGALAGIAPTLGLLGSARAQPARDAAAQSSTAAARVFFRAEEAAFVDAAVARLIPEDALGPGALEANVTSFIDQQLAGPYGRAYRWYMEAPWPQPEAAPASAGDASAQGNKSAGQQAEGRSASAEGTKGAGNHKAPSRTGQGYQLQQTPAQLYRDAIPAIDRQCRQQFGEPFAQLSADRQDDLLHQLEAGRLALGEVPGDTFFAMLWQNTQEGFLADPVYGGNRGFAGWKLIGFPGPRYNYVQDIERYGQRYEAPFVSLVGRDPDRRREDR